MNVVDLIARLKKIRVWIPENATGRRMIEDLITELQGMVQK